jgi:hypothetical protein
VQLGSAHAADASLPGALRAWLSTFLGGTGSTPNKGPINNKN